MGKRKFKLVPQKTKRNKSMWGMTYVGGSLAVSIYANRRRLASAVIEERDWVDLLEERCRENAYANNFLSWMSFYAPLAGRSSMVQQRTKEEVCN